MSTSDQSREFDEWHDTTDVRMDRTPIATQTEADLLVAIDHGDHATRGVYADLLEENGELERAEFVRLQDVLVRVVGFPRRVVVDRCRELAATQDIAWRVLVARPPILNCWREAGCPRDWGSLAPTGLAEVRYCTTCESCIHYCADVRDSERYDERVEPFVIDVTNPIHDRESSDHGLDQGHRPARAPAAGWPADDPEGAEGGTTYDDSLPPWRRSSERRPR